MRKNFKYIIGLILSAVLTLGLSCAVIAGVVNVSNYDELKNEVEQGANDITITQDFNFNGTIEVPENRNVTISGAGLKLISAHNISEARHFNVTSGASLTISDLTLDGGGIGGGIEVEEKGSLFLEDEVIIQNCYSVDGGAIFTHDMQYDNLETDSSTVFKGNTALVAYRPPNNAAALYPKIQFASVSVNGLNHPLNNCDINYAGKDIVTYAVTYSANTPNTVNVRTYSDVVSYIDTFDYKILSNTNTNLKFTRAGYSFDGWNTQADGKGTSYDAGKTIAVSNSITFYAQWKLNGSNKGSSVYNYPSTLAANHSSAGSSNSSSTSNNYDSGYAGGSSNNAVSVSEPSSDAGWTSRSEATVSPAEQAEQGLEDSYAGRKSNPNTSAHNGGYLLLSICIFAVYLLWYAAQLHVFN